MSDINYLVHESMADINLYDSQKDYHTKSKHKTSKQNPYTRIDDEKEDLAANTLGISHAGTSFLQKASGGFGGIDKVLGKGDLDRDVSTEEAEKIRSKSANRFNRIFGEKIL